MLLKYNELCAASGTEARRSANAIWQRGKDALADAKKMIEYEARVSVIFNTYQLLQTKFFYYNPATNQNKKTKPNQTGAHTGAIRLQ